MLNCRGGGIKMGSRWQKFQTLIKWGGGQYKMRGLYFDRIPIKLGGWQLNGGGGGGETVKKKSVQALK